MKAISRPIIRSGASLIGIFALVVVTISPAGALTVSRITTDQPSTERCARVKTLAEASQAKLDERLSAMQLDFEKRLANITSRHDSVDQKATTFRAERNDKFEARVAELRNKDGLTDAQLSAIDTFENDLKSAELTRETAVDAARATYRQSLNQTVTEHQTALSGTAITFKKAVDTVLANAETNCGDAASVATLKSAIKTARDSFQTTRKTESVKAIIKQSAETRRAAVETANTMFRKSVATSTATLKSALQTK